MNIRNIVFGILAVILIAAGFVFSNFLASQKATPPSVPPTKYVPTVETVSVLNQPMKIPVPVTGSTQAKDGIDLFAEVQGTARFAQKEFRAGTSFQKGDVLIYIEDREFPLNVSAQRSRFANLAVSMLADMRQVEEGWVPKWEAFANGIQADAMLPQWPEMNDERERRFVSARNLTETYYSIRAQEERLQKFTIRAPFTGVLTQANVSEGALVRPNQNLGRFTGSTEYEVQTAVSVSDVSMLKVGNAVRLQEKASGQQFEGRVVRISNRVDPASQTVDVFVSINGRNVREGLFVEGQIIADVTEEMYSLPRQLLLDNKFVFAVQDDKLMKHEVQVIRLFNDQALVKGLENGTRIVTGTVAGAFEGMSVNLIN